MGLRSEGGSANGKSRPQKELPRVQFFWGWRGKNTLGNLINRLRGHQFSQPACQLWRSDKNLLLLRLVVARLDYFATVLLTIVVLMWN